MENKFNVVFQGMTEEVNAWAENFADSIGRNKNTIKGYLADNQNMFVGMGMTREAGAKLSEQMVSLALDLASFNNLNEDDAVNAMAKALMGESEAAKSLGAVINDNTIALAMEQLGYEGKFQTLTEAEKMEVRYQAVLMQSTDAVGDCARSLDSYKGRQIQLQSTTQKLKETIGSYLLPVMTKVLEKTNDAASGLAEHLEPAMQLVSGGAMLLVDNLDMLAIASATVGTALVANLAGKKASGIATVFRANAEAMKYFAAESGKAAIAQEVMAGTFSVSEIAVGVLTGKISIATAAHYGLAKAAGTVNAVIAANPIGAFTAALGVMVGGIYASRKKIQGLADDMVVQAESSQQAEENLVKLKERLDEFEGNPNKWGTEKREEYAALKQAIAETEEQVLQLQQAEADAAAAAAEKAADPVEIFRAATEQYANDAYALAETFWETYDGIYSKVTGWFGLFDEAKTSVETNVQKMMSAMQSLTIFKYDLTGSENAGIWDSSYVSTGVADESGVNETMKNYALEGVEFSFVKVADIVQFTESTADNRTDNNVEVLYAIDKVQGADFLKALGLENGANHYQNADQMDTSKYFYQSDVLIQALSAALTANSTVVKNAMEAYIAAIGGTAMPLTDSFGKAKAENLELGLYLIVETKKPCPVDRGKLLIGLECCRDSLSLHCFCTCPYSNVSGSCLYAINSDALAYINYLEEQLNAKADGSD